MNVSSIITKDYGKRILGQRGKNKANSNPISPKTKPIQTQSNPIKANSTLYLAKMAHSKLKYVDRLAQLTLNPLIIVIRKDLFSL